MTIIKKTDFEDIPIVKKKSKVYTEMSPRYKE